MLGSCEHCNEPSVCMNGELCLFPSEKLTYERSLFINVDIILVLAPCGFVDRCQPFGGTLCFHFQGCTDKAGNWRTFVGFDRNPSASHFTTDGQSADVSWFRAPSGTHDQISSHRSDS
jgi:hypothetical protein